MQVITTVNDWKKIRHTLDGSIGFVPTMGALHKGHASLIAKSIAQNDVTIVSIFVNSLQFNNIDDYKHYPDTLDADKNFLNDLNVDYLLLPCDEEMYPHKDKFFVETDHSYMSILEGAQRPGHFNGVLTIVLKLLNCIQATRIYFGEKDFQQYALVKAMVNDLFIDVDVIACKCIRETGGMPYSSRNSRLTVVDKKLAACAFEIIHQVNKDNIADTIDKIVEMGVGFEYLEIKDERVYVAIKINGTRLIDNFSICKDSSNCIQVVS